MISELFEVYPNEICSSLDLSCHLLYIRLLLDNTLVSSFTSEMYIPQEKRMCWKSHIN